MSDKVESFREYQRTTEILVEHLSLMEDCHRNARHHPDPEVRRQSSKDWTWLDEELPAVKKAAVDAWNSYSFSDSAYTAKEKA